MENNEYKKRCFYYEKYKKSFGKYPKYHICGSSKLINGLYYCKHNGLVDVGVRCDDSRNTDEQLNLFDDL